MEKDIHDDKRYKLTVLIIGAMGFEENKITETRFIEILKKG